MTATSRFSSISFLAFAVAVVAAFPQAKQPDLDRGKYIVETVAKCGFCHTPRDEEGNYNTARALMGGPLQIRATFPNGWATVAPRIASQPPGTDAEMLTLLTRGVWKTGSAPTAPMPQYRMTREDAEAVLAYLKSLPSVPIPR